MKLSFGEVDRIVLFDCDNNEHIVGELRREDFEAFLDYILAIREAYMINTNQAHNKTLHMTPKAELIGASELKHYTPWRQP